MIDYSTILEQLEKLHRRFPTVWSLKLIPRPSRLLLKMVRPGMRVLDVGAADRRLEKRITSRHPGVVYKSMDLDRGFRHDFYSLDKIKETFDLIILFEVIEHLDLDEGIRMFDRLRGLLSDTGRIVISTPNIHHPHQYWHNATHKTAYMYSELAGVMMSRGYEIENIYRTYNSSLFGYLLRFTVAYPIHRILDVDFAQSIVVVGAKGKGPAAAS